jgi:uncharacterized protein involved in outer membrane biogenesis
MPFAGPAKAPEGAVKLFSSKRRTAAVAALVLLLLFLLRPGASRLKSRIIVSISSAVGRSVDIGSVHVRLLPRPGFDLANLVVYDDPAFGAEPMLRASEVTAALRLTSLLRGRLEIARLDLTEPSLNLVHRESGGWNLEALVERAARTPLAPTAKAKSEPRPGFPYIEATAARINFKNGAEKKPFALTNADFSLWQESENAWGIRLRAQPVRIDLNLNDTGILQVNGTWQRAATVRDTPFELTAEWNRAQLGQLTKLFTGNDQGWRGDAQLDVTLKGTPANLQMTSNASIQDFRRYDITSGAAMLIAAHCDGRYSSLNHRFQLLVCNAPVGAGLIMLKGEMGLPSQHSYALVLSAENVPASAAVALAQRAKKNLPADLTANGIMSASVSIQENATSKLKLEGQGAISDFHLASLSNKAEFGPETVPFAVVSEVSSRKSAPGMRTPDGPHLEFGPFALSTAHGATATARGWISRSGYNFNVAGDADIAKALRTAQLAGLPALKTTADGAALMNLEIAGPWAQRAPNFSGPEITGTAKLRNVHVMVRGTRAPVEIATANLQLSPDVVQITKLSAKVADAAWTGSLEMPRGCGTPGACEIHFNLNANQIVIGDLNQWLNPLPKERPWYQVLESSVQTPPTFLETLRASGHVATERLQMKNLALAHAVAAVQLDNGKLQISDLNGDALGGKFHGDWLADYSVKPATCSGSGKLNEATLSRLSDVMEDAMKNASIEGTANANYQLKGPCAAGFWQSAEGTLQFDVKDGFLSNISLAEDEGPLKITRMLGQARLHDGELEMKDVKLDSVAGKFLLSGTVSLQRELELKLARTTSGPATGYAITGTLETPRVAPSASVVQARLKQ